TKLRPKTPTGSLHPVATSTRCRVCTYSPRVAGPQWCDRQSAAARSTSRCPGSPMSPAMRRAGRRERWGLGEAREEGVAAQVALDALQGGDADGRQERLGRGLEGQVA